MFTQLRNLADIAAVLGTPTTIGTPDTFGMHTPKPTIAEPGTPSDMDISSSVNNSPSPLLFHIDLQDDQKKSSPIPIPVGTHYCLAVGNDEGLELDETDEDEELCESNEEEVEKYKGEDVRRIQSGEGRQENSLRDYSLNSRGLIYKYRVVCA